MSDFAETDLPVFVLANFAVFPGAVLYVRLDTLSDLQRQAINRASASSGKLFIVKSRQDELETPTQSDLHSTGVIARIEVRQSVQEHLRIAITAETRAELLELQQIEGILHTRVRVIPNVAVTDAKGTELFRDAMSYWEKYEIFCHDAGLHVPGFSFSPPGLNTEDASVICDILSNGSQFRIEGEQKVHHVDLQPLLEELDPLKRFRLFGEIFQAELDRLKSDPELARKVEEERERRRQEEARQQEERAAKISKLKAIAAQELPAKTDSVTISWETLRLPMLPLRDAVIIPSTQSTFIVGREMSIAAVQHAASSGEIFVVAQRDPQIEVPTAADVFSTGVVARILQQFKLPDNNIKLTIQGIRVARIQELSTIDGYYSAIIEAAAPKELSPELGQVLKIAAELIGDSNISLEQRQSLLELWASKSPHQWLAECVCILEQGKKSHQDPF
jgi:ATP-dependent Lon protease